MHACAIRCLRARDEVLGIGVAACLLGLGQRCHAKHKARSVVRSLGVGPILGNPTVALPKQVTLAIVSAWCIDAPHDKWWSGDDDLLARQSELAMTTPRIFNATSRLVPFHFFAKLPYCKTSLFQVSIFANNCMFPRELI